MSALPNRLSSIRGHVGSTALVQGAHRMWMDGRIQVRFAEGRFVQPDADQLLLIAGDAGAGTMSPDAESKWGKVVRVAMPPRSDVPHEAGCPCCGQRSPWVDAFAALFQARARGEVVFFRAMVVDFPEAAAASLREALVSDSYLAACFVETRQG